MTAKLKACCLFNKLLSNTLWWGRSVIRTIFQPQVHIRCTCNWAMLLTFSPPTPLLLNSKLLDLERRLLTIKSLVVNTQIQIAEHAQITQAREQISISCSAMRSMCTLCCRRYCKTMSATTWCFPNVKKLQKFNLNSVNAIQVFWKELSHNTS